MPYKVQAYINSLKKPDNTNVKDEAEIVEHLDGSNYVAKYNGRYCTTFLNGINFQFYVDDVDGLLPDYQPKAPGQQKAGARGKRGNTR